MPFHSKGPMDQVFYGFLWIPMDFYLFLPAAVNSRCDRILWRRAADVEAGTNPLRSGAATFHTTVVRIYGSVSKPCTPGEHQNSW